MTFLALALSTSAASAYSGDAYSICPADELGADFVRLADQPSDQSGTVMELPSGSVVEQRFGGPVVNGDLSDEWMYVIVEQTADYKDIPGETFVREMPHGYVPVSALCPL